MNINPGKVSTFAGSGANTTGPGTGTTASFRDMGGTVVVGGVAYVATTGSIRKVDLTTGVVDSGNPVPFAGDTTATGCADSTDPAQVRFPANMSMDTDGTYLYTLGDSCGIRRTSIATGATSTVNSSIQLLGPSLAYAPYPPGGPGSLYAMTCRCGGFYGPIRIDLMSGTVSDVPLTNSQGQPVTTAYPTGMAADSTSLWVSTASTLWKIPLAGGNATTYTAPSGWPSSSIEGTSELVSAGSYLYVSGSGDTVVERITKATGAVVQIAGNITTGGYGTGAGTGTEAWFNGVKGLASDGTSLWVADSGNHRLRKMIPDAALPSSLSPNAGTTVNIYPGKVSPFAGSGANITGPGSGTTASFRDMGGMVVVGTVAYVATTGSIRKVDLTTGVVDSGNPVPFAGDATATGCTNGTDPSQVRFPANMSMDTDGTYLYTLGDSCGIRRTSIATGATSSVNASISLLGPSLTYAPAPGGGPGSLYAMTCRCGGFYAPIRVDPINGTVTDVPLTNSQGQPVTTSYPTGMAADSTSLWVSTASTLWKIPLAGGNATTYAAPTGWPSSSFEGTSQLISAGSYLYVSGFGDAVVERITKATGAVANIAGNISTPGYADGTGTEAWLNGVKGLASDGTNLWVADSGNHRLRKMIPDAALSSSLSPNATATVNIYPGKVSTFAGSGANVTGFGTGTGASFRDMGWMVVVGGVAYVATTGSIRKVDLTTGVVDSGNQVPFAGDPTATGCTNSTDPSQVRFPANMSMDTDGTYLYTLGDTCGIRRTSLATGATSSVNSSISLLGPSLTYAPDPAGGPGWLYTMTCRCGGFYGPVRVDPISGAVTDVPLTNSQGQPVTTSYPYGMAADSTSLWVSTYSTLWKVPLAGGNATTYTVPGWSIAGSSQLVSAGNYLYVSNGSQQGIERITKKNGAVGTIAGAGIGDSPNDSEWMDVQFGSITGLASDGKALWVADSVNHKLKHLIFADRRARELNVDDGQDLSSPVATSGDPVNTASGAYTETFSDLSLPGIGMPFTFSRYYNSAMAASFNGAARFGSVGWSDSLDAFVEPVDDGEMVHYPGGGEVRFTANADGTYSPHQGGVFDTLSASGGLFTLTQPDQTKYHFDSAGRLGDITDPPGHSIRLVYDDSLNGGGRLDHVIDTAGRTITFAYSSSCLGQLVSSITLPDGRAVTYTYVGAFLCQLSRVDELHAPGTTDEKYTTYGWSGDELANISHGTGYLVMNHYDSNGRVDQQQTSTTTTTYAYDPLNHTSTATTNGHTTTYIYTIDGQLMAVRDPYQHQVSYENYDTATDMPRKITRPVGQAWNYTYNAWGAVLTVTPPITSEATSYTYHPVYHTSPTSFSDGRSKVTNYVYYSNGNLQCVIEPPPTGSGSTGTTCSDPNAITYAYDPDGQLASITDQNGHTTTYDYAGPGSTGGLLQSTTTQTGLETSFGYNAYLQQTSMTTPQGNASGGGVWTYTYDDAGRMLTSTDPVSSADTTTYLYDEAGRQAGVQDAMGHSDFHSYLPDGTLCAVSQRFYRTCASGADTTYLTYDPDGRVFTVTDGDLHGTSYAYWDDGQVKSITQPVSAGVDRVFSYDQRTYDIAAGTSTVVEHLPSGDTVTVVSDSDSRPLSVSYSTPTAAGLDATPNVSYTYDAAGNVKTTGTINFSYDNQERLTGVGGYSYTDDPVGNITRRTYPDGSAVSYAYDGDDRLCGMNLSATLPTCASNTIDWDYSQLTSATAKVTKTFPGGSTVTTLDKAGRLTKIVNKNGTATLSSFDPTLDAAGFPATVAVTNTGLNTGLQTETQTYTFDSATGRLTRICYDAGGLCGAGTNITGVAYGYDHAGNVNIRTVSGGANGGTTTYGYDWSNGLTSVAISGGSTTTYGYTANGDRRSATTGTSTDLYRYDLAHRLTKSNPASGIVDAYTYDALGNRTADTQTGAGAVSTTYSWDPNAGVAQLTSANVGGTQNDFYTGGGLQAMRSGSATYYYDKDHTGSVANVVRGSGTLEYSYSYQPYGTFRSNKKNDASIGTNFNPMTFQSEYRDTGTTGFFDLRARMYDPATANFLTADPAGSFPSYSFAAGNPAMLSDPSGMSVWSALRSALDWFNRNVNPGYKYLEACWGSDGTESLGSWAAKCALASSVLVGTAVFLTKLPELLRTPSLRIYAAEGRRELVEETGRLTPAAGDPVYATDASYEYGNIAQSNLAMRAGGERVAGYWQLSARTAAQFEYKGVVGATQLWEGGGPEWIARLQEIPIERLGSWHPIPWSAYAQ